MKAWFQCIGNWGSMKMLIFMRMARFRQLLLRPYFAWISWCSSLLWLFLPVFETIWSHWSCTNLDLITSLFSSKTRVIWSGNTIYSLNPLTFSVREHYLGKDFSFSEVNGFFFSPKLTSWLKTSHLNCFECILQDINFLYIDSITFFIRTYPKVLRSREKKNNCENAVSWHEYVKFKHTILVKLCVCFC